ncbi:DUF418 domain-containing protein [Aneurinibacillus migulanus]|uniref:DUF418 domain-containing protein n=1 Tax=Aneurinibacillus migulanus TaxID=47500 RepID=A0A0D1YLM8_ANEMI|nr:DUF418 domain-containing protein [Aneurinibacillus migulanus]KIV59587.1 hypothetical protein TS65_02600 [Aneurinibacillus migulanus]KON93115.1 hypothetical protein AF333_25935 [Aneurinibacillus migulanus]MED0890994.1 DUF418 domain-containing protein [Aneurinibacillus migulanus]MED1614635.1 DUF418 domain-containing protein [Aneurinibacillus migulanus]SDK12845.1 uncharacterized protein SAMN04487909_1403 [Aneurinibacillus migulanus]
MKSQPITKKDRIISLDIIRGIALFGILLINVPAFIIMMENSPQPDMSGFNGILHALVEAFIEKKFFSIFSFLFGVGFYIFVSRAEERGDRYYLRYVRRLLALLLFGIINALFIFWGDILHIYALFGFVLLPFYKLKPKNILLSVGLIAFAHWVARIVCMTVFSPTAKPPALLDFIASDSLTIIIMFLLGLYAAKSGLVRNVSQHLRTFKITRSITFVLFVIFAGIILWITSKPETDTTIFYQKSFISLGAIPMTLFYLSTLFILLENKALQNTLRPIGHVGQMAFTNYIGQALLGRVIISFMGLEVISPLPALIISLVIYAIEVMISTLWLRKYKQGPLEWLWRRMTYGKPSV